MLITITQSGGSIPCDLSQLPETVKKTISGQIRDLLTKVEFVELGSTEQREADDITVVIEELTGTATDDDESDQDYSCVVCHLETEAKPQPWID